MQKIIDFKFIEKNSLAYMAIVNCTPDSFSDGVKVDIANSSIEKALALVEAGAHILDIGGESTRPGAKEISVEEEWQRIMPVIEALAPKVSVPISIDTRKAAVARRALDAGASIINDVSGCRYDPEMEAVIREYRPAVILTHSRGTPETMMQAPHITYTRLIEEIKGELLERCRVLESWGAEPTQICVDPGFGFAKTPAQSLELLQNLEAFHALPYPTLIALSRKGFLGHCSGETDPGGRDPETVAALAIAYQKGFRFFRVHNVEMCRKFFSVYMAIGHQ